MDAKVAVNGKKLREIRLLRNLTQGQLEAKSGIGQGHISHLEGGERPNAKIATIVQLAVALDVSVNELLISPLPIPQGTVGDRDLPDFHMYISRKFHNNPRLQRALIAAYEALESVREEREPRVRALVEEIERTRRLAEERKKKEGEEPKGKEGGG